MHNSFKKQREETDGIRTWTQMFLSRNHRDTDQAIANLTVRYEILRLIYIYIYIL